MFARQPAPAPPARLAAYGSTQDYYLSPGWPAGTLTLPHDQTVTIPANQSEVVITVIPKADNLTENNVIVLEVRPDTVVPVDYSVGPASRAEVLLWDGPEFSLVELTGVFGPSVYGTEARAVNAGAVDSSGTWTVQPQAVGTATWQSSGPETHGTLWTPTSIHPATDFGATFRPYGISHRPSLAAGDRARVVGAYVNAAWRVLDDGTGGVQLPHFTDTTGPSLAWGISPDYSRAVGYSTLAGKKKPAVWLGTATPANLAQGLGSDAAGEARAVNNAGVIVGFASGFDGGSILRPFRSDGSNLDNADDLPVPAGDGEGRANALTTVGANHHVVGSYSVGFPAKKTAAYWTGNPLPSVVTDLKWLKRNGVFDLESEALGINSSLKIVGWSGASDTDANRHAVLSANGAVWVDLNDKHFTHGLDGTWTLQRANAISDHGVIVGLGTKSGSSRGFILVPRVPGN